MKLNLGCNDIIKKGYINVDLDKKEGVDVVWDLNKSPYPFKNNSADEILADNVLEHLKNLGIFVTECQRILKPRGKLIVRTDHAGYLPQFIMPHMEHNKMLKGHYNNKEDCHYCLFVKSHLESLFKDFKNIKITYPNLKRKFWKNLILNVLPFKLGKMHIKIECKNGSGYNE